jgi:hypothetical protein
MVDVATKYISDATYVVRFKTRNVQIRLKQGDAEKAFGRLFPTQSQQTNLPDDFDPNAPRIIFRAPHKTLSISQVGCQLEFAFEKGEKSLADQIEIIRKNVKEFNEQLTTFVPQESLGETAIILSVNYPCAQSMESMHKHLWDRFFKQQPHGDLASFSFKVGYRTPEQLFLNYEPSVYQLRLAEFQPQVSAPTFLNIESIPVIEEGFGVRVDINDKPKYMASQDHLNEGADLVLKTAFDFVTVQLDDVMNLKVSGHTSCP